MKVAKGFTNHEQTDPSGLIYMQARFYAPWYGRFLSPDPARDQHFEETQSWNIYSYVQNNPVMMTDPTGMYSLKEVLQAAAGVAVGAWQRGNPVYQAAKSFQAARAAAANPQEAAAQGRASAQDKGLIGAVAPGVQTAKEIIRAIDAPGATPYSAGKPIGAALADIAIAAAPGASVPGSGVTNPVPSTMARVIPEGVPATTLGRPGKPDVFVTGASDISGMNAAQLSQRLTIPSSANGFQVIEFSTPKSGVASPVFRPDPGFVGGGKTAGGAREFVIPNQPIPADATIRKVN